MTPPPPVMPLPRRRRAGRVWLCLLANLAAERAYAMRTRAS